MVSLDGHLISIYAFVGLGNAVTINLYLLTSVLSLLRSVIIIGISLTGFLNVNVNGILFTSTVDTFGYATVILLIIDIFLISVFNLPLSYYLSFSNYYFSYFSFNCLFCFYFNKSYTVNYFGAIKNPK